MWEIFHVAVNNVSPDTSMCTAIRYSKFNCTAAPLPLPCQEWGGRGGSQSVPGGWLFPSRKGVSVALTVPPLGLCRELHLHLNVQHQPQPSAQSPCSAPTNHVLQASQPFCPWLPSQPLLVPFPQRKFTPSSGAVAATAHGPHRGWQRSTALGLLLCWAFNITWSAQQTTNQPSPAAAQLSTLMASYTTPDIRPSRMISLSRTYNFYFQGKKLNWQGKPFVKHKARNNTFSFKQFFTASSLQIFALSLQKIPKKFSVYSISECHNLQKNK